MGRLLIEGCSGHEFEPWRCSGSRQKFVPLRQINSEWGRIIMTDLLVLTGWESVAPLHKTFFFISKQPSKDALAFSNLPSRLEWLKLLKEPIDE